MASLIQIAKSIFTGSILNIPKVLERADNKDLMRELLTKLETTGLLKMATYAYPCFYPEVVAEFYTNSTPGTLKSVVMGFEVEIKEEDIRKLLSLPGEEAPTVEDLNLNEENFKETVFIPRAQHLNTLKVKKKMMVPEYAILLDILYKCVDTRTTALNEVNAQRAKPLTAIISGIPFNWSRYVQNELLKYIKKVHTGKGEDGTLPLLGYGFMIGELLKKKGIVGSIKEETTWRKILYQTSKAGAPQVQKIEDSFISNEPLQITLDRIKTKTAKRIRSGCQAEKSKKPRTATRNLQAEMDEDASSFHPSQEEAVASLLALVNEEAVVTPLAIIQEEEAEMSAASSNASNDSQIPLSILLPSITQRDQQEEHLVRQETEQGTQPEQVTPLVEQAPPSPAVASHHLTPLEQLDEEFTRVKAWRSWKLSRILHQAKTIAHFIEEEDFVVDWLGTDDMADATRLLKINQVYAIKRKHLTAKDAIEDSSDDDLDNDDNNPDNAPKGPPRSTGKHIIHSTSSSSDKELRQALEKSRMETQGGGESSKAPQEQLAATLEQAPQLLDLNSEPQQDVAPTPQPTTLNNIREKILNEGEKDTPTLDEVFMHERRETTKFISNAEVRLHKRLIKMQKHFDQLLEARFAEVHCHIKNNLMIQQVFN
ncbi:unnamed protein product [Cuscuta europaea]|uniref:Putative plant transposon protein domain-containing protein n=1 Tax=Cuscuta europaea TaxID=41803 RepID=A0A9P1EC35_CUSEU|nr:unnamed protein product [Cuscuta europaea]